MIPEKVFRDTVMGLLEPVRAFLEAPEVSEILINGPDEIYVERRGRLELTEARFEGAHALEAAVRNIAQFVGKSANAENPVLEARLPDGSRVEAVLPPVSRRGVCMAIRKFSEGTLTLRELVELGTITNPAAGFLEACVRAKRNILVAGGTGSGKTSFLAALGGAIRREERIVIIEDSSELIFKQPHVVSFEARPEHANGEREVTLRELLRATFRLRPDRIVIGEVRGGEALDLVQAMISGHGGGLSTVHATRPSDALRRLETLALMSDVSLPLLALRSQIVSAIDVIVLIERMRDGARKVTAISEAVELDPQGEYVVEDLFAFDGKLAPMGVAPSFARELRGERLDPALTRLWGL